MLKLKIQETMSNLIDNHVPDFLLSPRFKFVNIFCYVLLPVSQLVYLPISKES